jgi:predicted Zn-dependent peptidase
MDHLDAATLTEFQDFNKKFYIPNNAVLVVAGTLTQLKLKNGYNNTLVLSKKGTAIETKLS